MDEFEKKSEQNNKEIIKFCFKMLQKERKKEYLNAYAYIYRSGGLIVISMTRAVKYRQQDD